MGVGKYSWEIRHVDAIGVMMQFIYDTGSRYMKLNDLLKESKAFTGKMLMDLAGMVREGMAINLAQKEVSEIEVVVEDGRLKMFVTMSVKWMPGTMVPTFDDVEEMMTEGGYL